MLSGLLFCLFIVSCGKVVQNSVEEEDTPIFTLKFSSPIYMKTPTDNINAFTIDDDIYTVISGIKSKKRSQLSWGKASVEKIPVTPTANSTLPISYLYKSKVFNDKGIEITASDHTWIYGIYNQKQNVWEFESKELRRKYPRYLVTTFTDQDHYQMKFIYDDVVSGNAVFKTSTISNYDTFLSILQLIQMETDGRDVFNELLVTLYDEAFFTLLHYTLPENKTTEFSVKQPLFIFDRSLETQLLTLADLAAIDVDEALLFLDELKEPLLSVESKSKLASNLKALKPKH